MLSLSSFRRTFLALLFLAGLILPSRAQSVNAITVGNVDTLYSPTLDEKRPFFISVPASYAQDEFYKQKRYPVLILLDADTHFRYAASMIHQLSASENEKIPEMIVVAVQNTNRTRDMTSDLPNKENRFSTFLEKELMPYIDQSYRTLPYRILVGHSLAGLFTLNCFLNQQSFNAYIAIDPTLTWDNGYLPKKAETLFKTTTSFHAKVYLTQANNPFDPGQHVGARGKAFDAFKASLGSNNAERLTHRYAYYERETHFSVPFQSLYDGLLFIFENYELPFQTLLTQGSDGISKHYQQLVTQLGVNLQPPGKVINQAGLFLLQGQNQVDKALALFQLNVTYYPDSPIVYRSLGEAYQTKGEKALAIQNYKKALALNAKDEKASKAIQELTNR